MKECKYCGEEICQCGAEDYLYEWEKTWENEQKEWESVQRLFSIGMFLFFGTLFALAACAGQAISNNIR